jgi:hypothetical protein
MSMKNHFPTRLSGGTTLVAFQLGAAFIAAGLLVLPLTSARAQDSLPWQKPWDNAVGSAKPARSTNPAAGPAALPVPGPSRLGADDPDATPAPYATNGYGSSPGYGNSPSYGSTRPSGNAGYGEQGEPRGNPAPAPFSTSQGYGNSGYGNSGPSYTPPNGGSQGGYGAPPASSQGYGAPLGAAQGRGNDAYQAPRVNGGGSTESYGAPYGAPGQAPGQAYDPEPEYGERAPRSESRSEPRYDQAPRRYTDEPTPGRGGSGGYYSKNEITSAGQGFFGSVTRGLASAIEYTYQKAGRPNGYVLGEDGGGAFIAGLRYGEGTLFTKDAGQHKIYWQGPSLGYDIGAEGSKTMVLVYNMRDIGDMFNRFGGIEGSAYLIGGVSVQFQKYGDVTLALIRSGVGLRLGANVGYLKYSAKPTWNPF